MASEIKPNLDGKIAVVTGACNGIGYAMVQEFLAAKATVVRKVFLCNLRVSFYSTFRIHAVVLI